MKPKFVFIILNIIILILLMYLISIDELLIWSWILFYMFGLFLIISIVKCFVKDNPHSTYEGISNLYKETGIFSFEKEKFYVNQNGKIEAIKWREITKIVVYKTATFDNLIFNIEIYTALKAFKFDDESKGLYKLTSEINKNLIVLDRNWTIINYNIHNNERKIIYDKEKAGSR